MCGLCGMLGAPDHWSDLLPPHDPTAGARRKRLERMQRVAYLNGILNGFSCSVSDWQGRQYLLSTFTGKSELVDDLQQLWAAVERLTGRTPDPLSVSVPARQS